MHTLEQVRGVIRALQTSMIVLLTKIDGNTTLKTLTVLAKKLLLVTWLCPGHVSTDGCITVLKVQIEMEDE